MTTSLRRTLMPLTLLAALAACGPAEKPVPPLKVDACHLFTLADATAVAHGEALNPMASTLDEARGRDPGQCLYNSGTLAEPRILSLLIRQHRTVGSARRVQDATRSNFSSMAKDVRGLGDGAIWIGGKIEQLHVLRGAAELIITVQSPDGTDQLPNAERIARLVLTRLDKIAPRK